MLGMDSKQALLVGVMFTWACNVAQMALLVICLFACKLNLVLL